MVGKYNTGLCDRRLITCEEGRVLLVKITIRTEKVKFDIKGATKDDQEI